MMEEAVVPGEADELYPGAWLGVMVEAEAHPN